MTPSSGLSKEWEGSRHTSLDYSSWWCQDITAVQTFALKHQSERQRPKVIFWISNPNWKELKVTSSHHYLINTNIRKGLCWGSIQGPFKETFGSPLENGDPTQGHKGVQLGAYWGPGGSRACLAVRFLRHELEKRLWAVYQEAYPRAIGGLYGGFSRTYWGVQCGHVGKFSGGRIWGPFGTNCGTGTHALTGVSARCPRSPGVGWGCLCVTSCHGSSGVSRDF